MLFFFSTWKRIPSNLTLSLFFFPSSILLRYHPTRRSRRGFLFLPEFPSCFFGLLFLAFVQGERLVAFDHGSRAIFVATPACVESRDWHRPTASRSVYHQHPKGEKRAWATWTQDGPWELLLFGLWHAATHTNTLAFRQAACGTAGKYTHNFAVLINESFLKYLCVCTAVLITRRKESNPGSF